MKSEVERRRIRGRWKRKLEDFCSSKKWQQAGMEEDASSSRPAHRGEALTLEMISSHS